MVGDSFTMGLGVAWKQCFCTILGRLFERKGPSPSSVPRVEVVNLGMNGYATDQELIVLKEADQIVNRDEKV